VHLSLGVPTDSGKGPVRQSGMVVDAVQVAGVVHRDADPQESARANRQWWDAEARAYQDEHGAFLGDADLLWCPEGLREADAHLLGEVRGSDVLEVGCGAGQGGRWLVAAGARVTAFDISHGQLLESRRLDARTGTAVHRVVQADAQRMPFRDASFDLVVSAFGGIPFVADSARTMRECARLLRPGGRLVFSVTHPVEVDDAGQAVYVEHHRTLGDRVRELVAAGLVLQDLIEPEWPPGHEREWGQWSPLRGRLLPGTAIFVALRLPTTGP